MWRVEPVFINALHHDLVIEINISDPGAPLSANTRHKLEKYSLEARRRIVNRVKQGSAVLFRACKKGQVKIAEYLIKNCGADIEQEGVYSIHQDTKVKSNHIVTPLWCAAVSGKLEIVELLLKAGADINAVSDSGSTPIRSACFMTQIEVVKFLVEHGADINRPNFNGGTCLINSVQSAELCNFLLENGADVNAKDVQSKTALHYAIQEHRLETTKILLDFGADHTARSRYADDALQMACLKADEPIFEYLIANISYKPERIANAHELIGASFLDDKNDITSCLNHWRKALIVRDKKGLYPKVPILPANEAYRHQKEFETEEELSALEGNMENIRTQSLLITERVLGTHHKDTIFRVMYRGAAYADATRYQRCIELWRRALQLRVERDSILFSDSQFTAKALVKLMVDYNRQSEREGFNNREKRLNDIVGTFKLIGTHIVWAKPLLQIRPQLIQHLQIYEKIMRYVNHLIFLLIQNSETGTEQDEVTRMLTILTKHNLTCFITGNSLLHLVVSKENSVVYNSLPLNEPKLTVPRDLVANVLLSCGGKVNVTNYQGATPLHVATRMREYCPKLVKVLLDCGAHLDQADRDGYSPLSALKFMKLNHNIADVPLLKYTSLKCLCATQIVKYKIPYKGQLPNTLEKFMKLHEPKPLGKK